MGDKEYVMYIVLVVLVSLMMPQNKPYPGNRFPIGGQKQPVESQEKKLEAKDDDWKREFVQNGLLMTDPEAFNKILASIREEFDAKRLQLSETQQKELLEFEKRSKALKANKNSTEEERQDFKRALGKFIFPFGHLYKTPYARDQDSADLSKIDVSEGTKQSDPAKIDVTKRHEEPSNNWALTFGILMILAFAAFFLKKARR